MSNYYTGKYNRFIEHAEEIYRFLAGSYMEQYENHLLSMGEDYIVIDAMQFVRILQYRKTNNMKTDLERIKQAMMGALGYCRIQDVAFGYFLVSDNGKITIYLATEGISAGKMKEIMSASIPDLEFQDGFISGSDFERLTRFCGIVNGDVDCNTPVMDKIIASFGKADGVIAVLAIPMDDGQMGEYKEALYDIQQTSSLLLDHDMTYSPQTRKTNRRTYNYVSELRGLADQLIKYFDNAGENFWKTCIWYGCAEKQDRAGIGSAIAGILNAGGDCLFQTKAYHLSEGMREGGSWLVPTAHYGVYNYDYPTAILKPSLLSYVSLSHLASVLQLPTEQVNGFEVIDYEKNADSIHIFDLNKRNSSSEAISIGKVMDTGEDYSFELRDMAEHVLVTGATGTGKTNTVMKLVKGFYGKRIPTLIIEPSKKDYWQLVTEMPELQVYSFGYDAELLRINPLEPEEGVIIGNHIDSLLYAFSGAFEMEVPTKLAMNGLLKYVYEKCGWNVGELAHHLGKRYPNMEDLLHYLPEYCSANLSYGEEVRSNILGSLANRLATLNSGITGEAFNSERSIGAVELCNGMVLVELDDLALDVKPFVAMLVLIKIDQYLRQKDSSRRLGHMMVLEEAHNIFSNIESVGERINPRAQASEFFSNMLSQIRGYGAGIVIADQGPSQINSMAVANTKIKIIHGIVDGQDIDKVAFALGLTDIQKRIFPTLPTGEAIISTRGERNVFHVQMDSAVNRPVNNFACMFCRKRAKCTQYNDKEETRLIPRRALYAQQLYQNRYDSKALLELIEDISDYTEMEQGNKFCILGSLLADSNLQCSSREKRRIVVAVKKEMGE